MVYNAWPTFRFDDVCINSDMKLTNELTDYIKEYFKNKVEIIWAVSPIVFDMSEYKGKAQQRIFPEMLNAYSDHRKFYEGTKAGLPELRKDVSLAGHGLVHVDHRLMEYSSQELSIVQSCRLINAHRFVPPFNKYNESTISICRDHGIELVKFEDGWLSMEYNMQYLPNHQLWYLHAREWTLDKLKQWFNGN